MDTRFCDFLARCSFSTNFFKSSDNFDFPFWSSDILENEVYDWRELCFFLFHPFLYHFLPSVHEIRKEHVLSFDRGVLTLCSSSLEFHSSSIEKSNPLVWRQHQHDPIIFRLHCKKASKNPSPPSTRVNVHFKEIDTNVKIPAVTLAGMPFNQPNKHVLDVDCSSNLHTPLFCATEMKYSDEIADEPLTPGGELDNQLLEDEYLKSEKGKMNTLQVGVEALNEHCSFALTL